MQLQVANLQQLRAYLQKQRGLCIQMQLQVANLQQLRAYLQKRRGLCIQMQLQVANLQQLRAYLQQQRGLCIQLHLQVANLQQTKDKDVNLGRFYYDTSNKSRCCKFATCNLSQHQYSIDVIASL